MACIVRTFFQEVKGLYAYALDRMEICLRGSLELRLVRFVFSKEEDEESVKIMFYLYFLPCGIISCMQLLFDMFSTLMSLEVRLN